MYIIVNASKGKKFYIENLFQGTFILVLLTLNFIIGIVMQLNV